MTPLLAGGDVPEQMDIPRLAGPSFDQVLVAGKAAGYPPGAPAALPRGG